VSKHIQSEPHTNPLSEEAKEIAQKATDAAQDFADVVEDVANDVTNATKETANRATEKAKEIYQSAALKAADTLAISKEYVRRNPVPVVLGAVAFGVAIGYMLMMARRKPTFSERYVDEPLVAVREALLGTFAPVAKRGHKGYDSALDGAEKVMDRVHSFSPRGTPNLFSNQMGRVGNNLKFW
jgi:ElaB/YqjD/DUF883 family membrane-anchored ribosome-binding protein